MSIIKKIIVNFKKLNRIKQNRSPDLKKKRRGLSIHLLVRYIMIGLLNTVIGILILFLLHALGIPDFLVIILASVLGLIYSYLNYRELVFKTFSKYQWMKYLFGFAVITCANIYIVNYLSKNLPFMHIQMILVPIFNIVSFIYNNWFVFV